jgi:hypothetical protein
MEPLSPEEKNRILQNQPDATQQDIEEYERLLSQNFATDPRQRVQRTLALEQRETRLAELYQKLYGKRPGEPPVY